MKTQNKFQETKIKMVMKLRGLTREAAIKALHLDETPDDADVGGTRHLTECGERVMTAKEFFGDLDDDDEFMSAEEFFKS